MKDQKFFTTATGVKVPWIIYGTAWKKEHTADLVVKAIQTGFKGIDTACQPKHYDEKLVGVALQRLKAMVSNAKPFLYRPNLPHLTVKIREKCLTIKRLL